MPTVKPFVALFCRIAFMSCRQQATVFQSSLTDQSVQNAMRLGNMIGSKHLNNIAVSQPMQFGLTWIAVGLGLMTLFVAAVNYQTPLWIQPTCVGLIWGLVFFGGVLLESIGKGKLIAAAGVFFAMHAATTGFHALTDISYKECLLVTVTLCSSGWIAAKFALINVTWLKRTEDQRGLRFTLWDIVLVTTAVAVFCSVTPQMKAPSLLMMSVLLALVGGTVCSWLALRWAWYDGWSLSQTLLVVLLGSITLAFVFSQLPSAYSLLDKARWLLVGPLNVIAAQSVYVLLLAALLRLDTTQSDQRLA